MCGFLFSFTKGVENHLIILITAIRKHGPPPRTLIIIIYIYIYIKERKDGNPIYTRFLSFFFI